MQRARLGTIPVEHVLVKQLKLTNVAITNQSWGNWQEYQNMRYSSRTKKKKTGKQIHVDVHSAI